MLSYAHEFTELFQEIFFAVIKTFAKSLPIPKQDVIFSSDFQEAAKNVSRKAKIIRFCLQNAKRGSNFLTRCQNGFAFFDKKQKLFQFF